jgi:hypothetical protein
MDMVAQKKKGKMVGRLPQTSSVAMELIVKACRDVFEPYEDIENHYDEII